MTQTNFRDLRIIIGEDEQLLAIDMVQQFEALGAQVVGIAGSIAELEQLALDGGRKANAAILDVGLTDGQVYDLVPQLEQHGIAVVFCTGYHHQDRPQGLAHIPWLGKPARGEDIVSALRQAVAARRDHQID